jgi:hypothetical protein
MGSSFDGGKNVLFLVFRLNRAVAWAAREGGWGRGWGVGAGGGGDQAQYIKQRKTQSERPEHFNYKSNSKN